MCAYAAARQAARRGRRLSRAAHVIVVGAGRAGAGKTTIAAHLALALCRAGRRVAAVDLDASSRALSRWLTNRSIEAITPAHESAFVRSLGNLSARCEYIVIDTANGPLTRAAHAFADTLITLVQDGAELGGGGAALTPSAYSELVWESRKQKAQRRGAPIDWVVMCGRAARSAAQPCPALAALAGRIGFRVVPSLTERPALGAWFAARRSLLDRPDTHEMAFVAARQELREFVSALKLGALRAPAAA